MRRDPLRWVLQRLEMGKAAKARDQQERRSIAYRGISMVDLQDRWSKVVEVLKSTHDMEVYNPESALEGALSIR